MKTEIVNSTGAPFVKSRAGIEKFDDMRRADSTSSPSAASATSAENFKPTEASPENPQPGKIFSICGTSYTCLHYEYSLGDSKTPPFIGVLFQKLPSDTIDHAFGENVRYDCVVYDFKSDKMIRGYTLLAERADSFPGGAFLLRLVGRGLIGSVRI
jgi:hypothetical protein